jgi:hypothetical protein
MTGRRAAATRPGMIRLKREGPGRVARAARAVRYFCAGGQVAAVLVGQGCGDGRVREHCLLLSGGTGPGTSRRSPSRLLSTAQPRQRSDYPFRAPPAEGVKLPQADSVPGSAGSGQTRTCHLLQVHVIGAVLPQPVVSGRRQAIFQRNGRFGTGLSGIGNATEVMTVRTPVRRRDGAAATWTRRPASTPRGQHLTADRPYGHRR